MGHALQTTTNSLDASILALKTSYNALSETMTAVHEAIKENHLVYLPKATTNKASLYELEVQIENDLYLVFYSSEKYGSEYDIIIHQIEKCPIQEIEYRVLSKIEKTIHDHLLNECDMHYYKKHYDWIDYDTAFEEGRRGNY